MSILEILAIGLAAGVVSGGITAAFIIWLFSDGADDAIGPR